jgi:hypothetical protein
MANINVFITVDLSKTEIRGNMIYVRFIHNPMYYAVTNTTQINAKHINTRLLSRRLFIYV